MINKIIIGSRKSKLSLAYTKKVKELIAKSCKFSKSKIYFKGILQTKEKKEINQKSLISKVKR